MAQQGSGSSGQQGSSAARWMQQGDWRAVEDSMRQAPRGPALSSWQVPDETPEVPAGVYEDGSVEPLLPIQVLERYYPDYKVALDALEDRDTRLETLRSSMATLDPPDDLHNWARLLSQADVHPDVCGNLGALANRDPMGHAEATRLMAHLIKPGTSFERGASGWMAKGIQDAENYLTGRWSLWESPDPDLKGKGKGSFGPPGSSSSKGGKGMQEPTAPSGPSGPSGSSGPSASSSSGGAAYFQHLAESGNPWGNWRGPTSGSS